MVNMRRQQSEKRKSYLPQMRLSDFEVEPTFLDQGSFSNVYLTKYGGKTVCLKIPRDETEELLADSSQQMLLENEILASLNSEYIVKALGAGQTEDGKPFLVLEYVRGGTWKDLVVNASLPTFSPKRQKISFLDRLHKILQLAKGLLYLHHEFKEDALLIHRDLKPNNIAFDDSGNLKLIDFGTAKLIQRSSSSDRNGKLQGDTFAMTGKTGTMRWMSPEVFKCEHYNEKTDVYSFALLAWNLLSLKTPYDQIINELTFEKFVVGEGMRPPVPRKWAPALRALLEACWAPQHQDRPPLSEVVPALQRLVDEEAARTGCTPGADYAARCCGGGARSARKLAVLPAVLVGKRRNYSGASEASDTDVVPNSARSSRRSETEDPPLSARSDGGGSGGRRGLRRGLGSLMRMGSAKAGLTGGRKAKSAADLNGAREGFPPIWEGLGGQPVCSPVFPWEEGEASGDGSARAAATSEPSSKPSSPQVPDAREQKSASPPMKPSMPALRIQDNFGALSGRSSSSGSSRVRVPPLALPGRRESHTFAEAKTGHGGVEDGREYKK